MTTVRSNDRRKSVRLKGRKESILIHPSGIRQIRDISLGGLSFHCPQDEFLPVQWPIEIIFAGTLLYMTEVPVRLVRERLDEVVGLTALPTKEIGVEFLDINEENRILLNRMLSFLQEDSTH
jgi:hypothetical protein